MLTGTDVDGPLDGVPSLAARLAASDEVASCTATQWFRYAFGRAEQSPGDLCTVDKLAAAFKGANGDGDFRKMVRATVRMARVPQPPTGDVAMSATRAVRSRAERSCAAPAARRSPCPGWRRWRPRRAQAATGAGQALHRDVLGERHDPVGVDADGRHQRNRLHAVADPVAAGAAQGRHRRGRRPRAEGRRRRRAPERHRRDADRPDAQRRSVRRRRRGPRRLADGPVGRSAHRRRAGGADASCARSSWACRSAPPTTGDA